MESGDDRPMPDRPRELSRLPRSVQPGDLLEERVVRALRERGILAPRRSGGGGGARGRRSASTPLAWVVTSVAAALALFVGGYALGQHHGTAAAAELATSIHEADARQRAALVQHTGSLWVMALAALADTEERGGDPAALGAGREAAIAGLRAAALELARMEPDDARVARVLDVLDERRSAGGDASARTIFWY